MQRTCPVCEEQFVAVSPRARYCGARCRKRASRHPESAQAQPLEVPGVRTVRPAAAAGGGELSVEAATLAELEAAGRVATVEGQKALLAARRLDSGRWESGMGLSAMMKEHSRVLAEAVKDANQAADPVDALRDELAAKRARRHAG